MKVIPLSEGAFTVDATKVFSPFDESTDKLKDRPVGSLLVEVQPFVVVTDDDILLLDTGLGFVKNGELQLHQLLKSNGISPSEVTKVLISHLHKDHSGGLKSATDDAELAFPDAKYYVQKRELEFALSGKSASYITSDIECLRGSANVVELDGDGVLDGYIDYELTAAHSRYHQIFRIRDGDRIIFFGGDDAPQYSQMKNRYVAKYDFDGRKCMELRKEWWEKGQQEHWIFLFYHDIKTPVIAP
jgi:glyoxylase-like metal-dependent hydrolase (beta-lactamase superfamily II)